MSPKVSHQGVTRLSPDLTQAQRDIAGLFAMGVAGNKEDHVLHTVHYIVQEVLARLDSTAMEIRKPYPMRQSCAGSMLFQDSIITACCRGIYAESSSVQIHREGQTETGCLAV